MRNLQNYHFIHGEEKRHYNIQGFDIDLVLRENVFPPSEVGGVKLASLIDVRPGESVVDVGTGSGIIAIVAAKKGGNVTATDISDDAVKLALDNASLNNVSIDAVVASYFPSSGANNPEKYDVIAANLPTEFVPSDYLARAGKFSSAFDGGKNGNEHVLEFLDVALEHMHDESRLYMLAYGLSDYLRTMKKISDLYDARLLDVLWTPAKDFVSSNPLFYLNATMNGRAHVFWENNAWNAAAFYFELRKKKNNENPA